MNWLSILLLSAAVVFIIMNAVRAFRIARAPVHLRWELYPVPHEKGKAGYGGSRLEEYEWWNKKQKKDYFGEFKVMAKEIFLLSAVRDHNKKLHTASFFFHFGLYAYILNVILLIINASVAPPFCMHCLILTLTSCSSLFGIVGSFLLLYRRITDKNYRHYNNASHFFNIIIIGSLFVSLIIWFLGDDNYFNTVTRFCRGIFTNQHAVLPVAAQVHIVIAAFLLVYIPFTHMTHFFTKYFLYHKVRWDDEPTTAGSKIEMKIASYLNLPVRWSAPHIGADGKKTWGEIATSGMPEGEKDGK